MCGQIYTGTFDVDPTPHFKTVWFQRHNITGDSKYAVHRQLHPSLKTKIATLPVYLPGPAYNNSTVPPTFSISNSTDETTLGITYDFFLTNGKQKLRNFSGIITCDFCMYFVQSEAVDDVAEKVWFDIRKTIKVEMVSDFLTWVGLPMIRYPMPSVGQGYHSMFRFFVSQAFRVAKPLTDKLAFGIEIQGITVARKDNLDKHLYTGDTIRTDATVKVEEEWATVSLRV